ncbi:ATP-binding cassette domain-containing protein [Erysipelothrix urinaevulpis]|uniref:ATP-binding cassette domain-containing protein n=1 Tax=Erysipelothrix urinaevulpis TaxID=2683717 RepID=UPI00135AFBC3|nr:ATP-binding cassette domain-containing protein [Erysipelothrix urinaevulpis]
MIKVHNLTHSYGDFKALDSINLTIKPKRVTALVGENGSGKSTLLNHLGRLLTRKEGLIQLEDEDIKKIKSRDYAQRVAIMKQDTTINLKLTVYEFVAFGRFPHKQGTLDPSDHEIIRQSLVQMGCYELKDKYINELSGGQIQRVKIALILCQDTDVILLDEPLNNLDLKYAHEMMETVRTLCDELSKTVVIVVHDMNMVYRYADDVVCMKNGKILADGTVHEVLSENTLNDLYGIDFEVVQAHDFKFCIVK